ncbi:right-handed parallel beta-helix repeat-containing protein [Kineococcus arenarius]|uniref:right-handed parallel beta-helix repeat-containing protein n=1 Tax=unclassified Kineococcus TaxID=2621656 RepID=UPI003D7DE91D
MHRRTTLTTARLTTACAALATGLLAAPAAAAPPRATTVECGAVLTTSVRLAADVVCPDGDGVVLAADGIELNLNGHALVGPGTSSGAGVLVRAEDVTVRNGTISGWESGVRAGTDPTDPYGEESQGPARAVVRQARLEANGFGVEVRQDGDVQVRNTWLVGNGVGGYVVSYGRLLVEDSTADGNGTGFSSFEVEEDGLVLRGSTVRGGSAGVSCSTDGNVVVERSTLQRNAIGLEAFLCSAWVSDSALVWNGEHVRGYLVDWDTVEVTCTTFTRDGGPLDFPVEPCATGGAGVSGTLGPWWVPGSE